MDNNIYEEPIDMEEQIEVASDKDYDDISVSSTKSYKKIKKNKKKEINETYNNITNFLLSVKKYIFLFIIIFFIQYFNMNRLLRSTSFFSESHPAMIVSISTLTIIFIYIILDLLIK